MAIWFALILAAYLLGSIPTAYLAARFVRGFDIRQHGTGQASAGNLWRMTSWKLGISVGAFDFGKGMLLVWLAQVLGLSVGQQLVVGAAVVVGHNWSLFLRFGGGRGVATSMGVALIIPVINIGSMTPWPTIACFTLLAVGCVVLRSSPLPVLASLASLPIVSVFFEPLTTTLGFLAIFLTIVVRRLAVPKSAEAAAIGKKRLLLNRLLFDRDIMDRKVWMYRRPFKLKDVEELSEGIDP